MQSIETILFWEAEKKITNNLYFSKYKDVKAKDGVIYKREETPAACDHTDNPPLSCTESMQERYYIRVASAW